MLLEEQIVMREPTVEDGEVLDQTALDHLHDIHQLQLLSHECLCHYRILYEFLLWVGEILKQALGLILLQ